MHLTCALCPAELGDVEDHHLLTTMPRDVEVLLPNEGWYLRRLEMADGRQFPEPVIVAFCREHAPKRANDPAAHVLLSRFVEAVRKYFPEEHQRAEDRK